MIAFPFLQKEKKNDQLVLAKFGKSDSEETWLQIYAQTSECYRDEMSQTPMWEIKRYVKQIVFRSIVNSHSPKDPLSKTLTQVLDLYSSPPKERTSTSLSPVLSSKQSKLVTLASSQPLPLHFELMPDENIGEQNQAAICFSCEIVSNEDTYVLMSLGINMEAERLFGYSKLELFTLYKSRHRFILARLIDPSQWEKVIRRELKAAIQGELAYRLYVTALNKWKCPIKVLLDIRVDYGCSFDKNRTNFFFIPLPVDDLTAAFLS